MSYLEIITERLIEDSKLLLEEFESRGFTLDDETAKFYIDIIGVRDFNAIIYWNNDIDTFLQDDNNEED